MKAYKLPTILFLIDALERPGGTETHLQQLVKGLPAEGFQPLVCNLAGDQPVLRAIADSGVESWPVNVKRLYTPAGREQVREVIARASRRNVAVVHTFHFKSDWMGVSVARTLQCPLVSSRRDLGFAQTSLRRLALRFIDPHVDAFIAPSHAVRDAVASREGVPAERIHVIYNGLDSGRFASLPPRDYARKTLGVPVDASVIGMVGNLRPIKDHPTLIRAMASVVHVHPGAHLVLVGEGSEENALRSLAASLGIADRVTFAGPTRDVPRVLAAFDVFALSSHSEGMSNAIIEAMAAGLPVVATDVGGNAECVVDGETGYIVPHQDVTVLAERLTSLLNDPASAAIMGAAGRSRVQELFNVQAMVHNTVDLYRRLGAGVMVHA